MHSAYHYSMTLPLPVNLQREWANNEVEACQAIEGEFSLLTYNILNGDLIPVGWQYPYCPEDLLTVARRHPLLMKELDFHDSDITCLQEVSCHYYNDVLRPEMTRRGYAGIHCKRPNERPPYDDRPWTDGSATFYRESTFECVEMEQGGFEDLLKQMYESDPGLDIATLPLSLIDSKRVYQFLLLKHRTTNRLLAVGNVHLTYKSFKRMDLVAIEAAIAINRLVHFGGTTVPHILCGDFNLEPHHPGYQLMHDGKLSKTMTTCLGNLAANCNNEVERDVSLVDMFPDSFSHISASLRSAYESVLGHEVPFSCYEDSSGYSKTPKKDAPSKAVQDLFDAVPYNPKVYRTDPEEYGSDIYIAPLDYIWYSSSTLYCNGVLTIPDKKLIEPFYACPNKVFPSDHLLLKVKCSFLKI